MYLGLNDTAKKIPYCDYFDRHCDMGHSFCGCIFNHNVNTHIHTYDSKRSEDVMWDIWPLSKKKQLLWSDYCPWPYLIFRDIWINCSVLLLIAYWQSFVLAAAPDRDFPQQPELLWLWGSCPSSLKVFSKPWWVCRSTPWLMQHCNTGIPLVAYTLRNSSATFGMAKSGSWIIPRLQTCHMTICLCSVLLCAGTRTCSGTSCRTTRGCQDLSLQHIIYGDSFTMRNVWRIISFSVVILLSLFSLSHEPLVCFGKDLIQCDLAQNSLDKVWLDVMDFDHSLSPFEEKCELRCELCRVNSHDMKWTQECWYDLTAVVLMLKCTSMRCAEEHVS